MTLLSNAMNLPPQTRQTNLRCHTEFRSAAKFLWGAAGKQRSKLSRLMDLSELAAQNFEAVHQLLDVICLMSCRDLYPEPSVTFGNHGEPEADRKHA